MGRLFLIDLNRIPEKPYYLCLTCGTHIAFKEDCLRQMSEIGTGVFDNLVNVLIDCPAHHREIPNFSKILGANIRCVNCNKFLGFKIARLEGKSLEIRVGDHIMNLARLLLRNGNQQFYANDGQPYPDA